MKKQIAIAFAAAAMAFAAPATYTGIITDNMCTKGDHSSMRMGPTDAECTIACIAAHGATYVLYAGRNVYTLSDQQTPEKFAGQRVRIVGTLDARTKTIPATTITQAAMTMALRFILNRHRSLFGLHTGLGHPLQPSLTGLKSIGPHSRR